MVMNKSLINIFKTLGLKKKINHVSKNSIQKYDMINYIFLTMLKLCWFK